MLLCSHTTSQDTSVPGGPVPLLGAGNDCMDLNPYGDSWQVARLTLGSLGKPIGLALRNERLVSLVNTDLPHSYVLIFGPFSGRSKVRVAGSHSLEDRALGGCLWL